MDGEIEAMWNSLKLTKDEEQVAMIASSKKVAGEVNR